MLRFGYGRSVGILLGLSAILTWPTLAAAQPPPDTNPPVIPPGGAPPTNAPAPPPPVLPPPPPPAAPPTGPTFAPPTGAAPQNAPTTGTPTALPDVGTTTAPPQLLTSAAGGLTADTVASRAAQTSYTAQAANANMKSAAARVDAAWSGFLPRLTFTGRYTRYSDFTPPSIGSGSIVGTPAAPGTLNPTPTVAASFAFPLVLNNYLLQANITVPISDYFFRIGKNYTAATRSQDAARWDVVTARAKSAADGKVAYYTWLRARGAVVVAQQALDDQRTRAKDAQNQFAAGNASRADVLRAEAGVSAAELAVEQAKNLADLAEEQVKVAMHAPEEEHLVPGESLTSPAAPVQGNVAQFVREAWTARAEVKSIDANAAAARAQADVQKAGAYPNVSAFGDAIEANPNPRRFPATQDWFATWDVGAQLVWSPNDILTANAGAADYESRANALEAQRGVTRDGIQVEVFQAYQSVREADFAVESARRQLASAAEASRVAHELFVNGRGTYTNVIDAATEYTRAELTELNAEADSRIARVRLEHALGRDVRPAAAGAGGR